MKTYTINKGCHYNTSLLDRFVTWGKPRMDVVFMLENSCWYDRRLIGSHINKLVGFSCDLFNKDSVRFGWRPSLQQNEFELYAYKHVNGLYVRGDQLKDDFIAFIQGDKDYAGSIETDGINATFSANFSQVVTPFSAIGEGWKMGFYFGGKPTAPQQMKAGISIA